MPVTTAQKNCRHCNSTFTIDPEDFIFYEKVSPEFGGKKYPIPPPTLCPDCRLQRRTAWRNERHLSKHTCGKCGKDSISIYAEDAKFPIYCNACWWGDGWDGKKYGRDFDFNRPFFEQFKELIDAVPQLTIQNDDGVGSVNCQYCQDFAFGKNCYFVIGSWEVQDSFHSSVNCSYSKDICDCTHVVRSELAYECTDSDKLYNCKFVRNSENSSDCTFGFDLKGCKDCFGCFGLRQKQYYIFNEPHTKEEYEQKITSFNLGSREGLEKMKKQYNEWVLKFPRKCMYLKNCQNSVGDNLFNCKDTMGFSMIEGEGIKYCAQGDGNKFSYDIFNCGKPQWCYEGITPDNSYLTHFSWFSWKCKNVLYGINCHSSSDLFGCVSLHRSKYCILNKQYTKEEYTEIMPRIIEHLQKNGEWGEFTDAKYSFYPYNHTNAQEYFPLKKEEVLKNGWQWEDPDPKEYLPQSYTVPDNIQEVSDDITQNILACQTCGKNYKIIPQELALYKKIAVPIPAHCPDCRHIKRIKARTPYKLFERKCAKCQTDMQTSYSPDRPETVYCEACYLKEVY